ncbi:MAG: hypothetical protein QMD21_01625 [Candidatus Thermoplasmatota archaeon]|nr:hypothetical protein [Candidatus Thermoplasmatota archaeon]
MVVGRFVGTEDEILVYGNRGLFFDKVRKATNAWKKVMGCFISYSHGLNFTGEGIFVSETIRETFEWFSKYSIFTANTTAIIENLTKGVGIWYHSSHGWINFTSNEGGIYGWNGFCERSYEEGGNLSEPDADKTGLVDPKNTKKITEDDFSSIKLKNTVCIILACKIGSSNFPYTLLGSGAACVIASPVELSFRQGGFLTNKVGELLVNGETIGNAIKISINQTKERTEEFDAPFLCFGEPSIKVLDHKIKCEVSVPKKILIPEITKINIRVFNEVGKPVHDADVKVNNTNAKYNPLFNSYSISCSMLSDYTNNVTVEIHKDMCGTLTLNTTVYVYPKVYRVTLFIICGLVISMIAIVFWRYRTKKKLS